MAFDMRARIALEALKLAMKQRVDILWSVDQTKQEGLHATVLFDRTNEIPEDSDDMSINETMISLISAQLDHEIVPGVKFLITYPYDMLDLSKTKSGLVTIDKAPIDGGSIGFINVFPKQTSQS